MDDTVFKTGDLIVGGLLILTGAILHSHFRKDPTQNARKRLLSLGIILVGFFLALGDFFYSLAFK
jgi:hypothetical protein